MKKAEKIKQRTVPLVGYNLKRLRLEHGLRNYEVICHLQLQGIEISSSTYSKLESGCYNPTVEVIMELVKFYKCSYDELFKEI